MKTIATLLSLSLAVSSLTACQQPSDRSLTQEKSLDRIIMSASAKQLDKGTTIREVVGAQETYSANLTDKKGKVAINVNAQVDVPDVDMVPLQKVERATFSQQAVDTVRKHLVKGELYAGSFDLTKEDLKKEIIALEESIAKGLPQNGRVTIEEAKKQLQSLKSQYEKTPDTQEKMPSSGKLEPFEDNIYSAGERLLGLAQSEAGGYESFTVFNDRIAPINLMLYTSEVNAFSSNIGYYITKENAGSNSYPTIEVINSIPDISLTKENAKRQADALIDALGIDYLSCYSIEKAYGGSDLNPSKCVWFLRYVRKVNDVPVTYTAYDCMKVEDNQQSAPWSYEDMTFAINDSGIVGFRWSSPYKLTGKTVENANLLSFKDITDVFSAMSPVVNDWDAISQGNPNLITVEINVDTANFGLARVTEKNKRDSGLLIPAWDFIGTMTYVYQVDGQTKKTDIGPIPILTINAMDGSVINRSLGY